MAKKGQGLDILNDKAVHRLSRSYSGESAGEQTGVESTGWNCNQSYSTQLFPLLFKTELFANPQTACCQFKEEKDPVDQYSFLSKQ